MTAAERRANLDATLQAIDSTLADYKADRREQWIEDNLNQTGQMYVPIGHEEFFGRWLDGLIDDEEAQDRADSRVRCAESMRGALSSGEGHCWLCGDWSMSKTSETHEHCANAWRDAIERVGPAADPAEGVFSILLRSDGTGFGVGEGGEDPPADLLVDGVGLAVSPFARSMVMFR